ERPRHRSGTHRVLVRGPHPATSVVGRPQPALAGREPGSFHGTRRPRRNLVWDISGNPSTDKRTGGSDCGPRLKGKGRGGPAIRGVRDEPDLIEAVEAWSSSAVLLQDTVSDESPLAADPARDRHALPWFRDDGDLERHVRSVFTRRRDDSDRRRGADGHHERLRCLDALDLEFLGDPDDALQQIDLDGHLHQDLRQTRGWPDDPTDEAVRLCEDRVEVRADRDEPARSDLLPP